MNAFVNILYIHFLHSSVAFYKLGRRIVYLKCLKENANTDTVFL